MVVETKSYLTAPMKWSLGDDPEYPYEAEHEGHKLLVRLNDFPEEELYALIADGEEIANFDEWPDSWSRPSVSEASNPQVVDDESESKIFSLFNLHGAQAYRYIRRLLQINGCVLPSEHSIEVANSVWSKALDPQHLKGLKNPKTFSSWLYTIAKNDSIAHLGKCTKKPVELEHDDSSEPVGQMRTTEEIVEASEHIQEILILAKGLDERLFQIMVFQLEGLSNQEIAEHLGITLSKVRTIRYRMLPKLKALLKETKE